MGLRQGTLHVRGVLERKDKPDEYVEKVERLIEEGRAESL